MKYYAVMIIVTKTETVNLPDGLFEHKNEIIPNLEFIKAWSDDEARGKAYKAAITNYPACDGWKNHFVVAKLCPGQ